MDVLFAVAAASVATWFSVVLYRSAKGRGTYHAEVWVGAFAAYALGTWALVAGLSVGWTSVSFRTFYFMGAIANIPLLALGSIALASERWGRRVSPLFALWIVLGFFATFLAPFATALPSDRVPEGNEVFGFTFMIDAATLPGPRIFAAIAGGVGATVVIALAAVSAWRARRRNRDLAVGNVLIVLGTLAPVLGGVLTAIGESAALSLSLLVGVTLLFAGYRKASAARRASTAVAPS